MVIRVWIIALGAIGLAQAASSLHDLHVNADTSFEMAVPDGLCLPDPTSAPNPYITLLETTLSEMSPSVRTLDTATFFECGALHEGDERYGKMPQQWGLAALASLGPDGGPLPGYDRRSFVQGMAKHASALPGMLNAPGLTQRIDEFVRDSCDLVGKECRSDFREVVAVYSDDEGLFMGMLANLTVGDDVLHIAAASGTTFVRGYLVSVASYRVLHSSTDYDAAMTQARSAISEIIARNDPEGAAVGSK